MSEMPGPLVGGERPRAVPGGADHHADRGQLILRLDDREIPLAGLGIDPVALAEALEGIHERGGRRDRIPRPHGRARVDAAEAGGCVAVDHDVSAGLVQPLDAQRQRAGEVLLRIVVAQAQRLGVRIEQLGLLAVALLHHRVDDAEIQVDAVRRARRHRRCSSAGSGCARRRSSRCTIRASGTPITVMSPRCRRALRGQVESKMR